MNKPLDTAYLSTILTEEQRTLLRFAVQLDVPIVIDGHINQRDAVRVDLTAHLFAAGVNVIDANVINASMEQYGQDNPAYIVLTLQKPVS